MEEVDRIPHLQVKFFTKQDRYSVPDSPFSVPGSVGIDELSSLINSLISKDDEDEDQIAFDFLIDGEFLRISLGEYVQQKDISTETVLELEYVARQQAPEPEDSLLHDDWVASVRGANDYILCGCYDNTLRLWNTEGEVLSTIPGHTSPVKCVAWINNSDEQPIKTFLSGSHDETAMLWQWNAQTNCVDCLYMCRGHAASVDCIAVDESKTRFCTGSWDKMLKIWSAKSEADGTEEQGDGSEEKSQKKKKTDGTKVPTRVPMMTLSGHNEGVSAAQWLSAGEVCTASWDHTLRLWDLQQAVCTTTLPGSKAVFAIDYSPVNKLVISGSADRHVRLYDPRATDGALVKSTFTSHTGWISCVAWSKTNPNLFLSGSYDNLVKLWDTRSPKAPLYDLTGHEDKVLCVDWSMPQFMLSGSSDNSLKIFKYQDNDSVPVNISEDKTDMDQS